MLQFINRNFRSEHRASPHSQSNLLAFYCCLSVGRQQQHERGASGKELRLLKVDMKWEINTLILWSLVPQVFKSILCKIVDTPTLPVVKHPINVYGHLYSEWDTAKQEGSNLVSDKFEAGFIYAGTKLLSGFCFYNVSRERLLYELTHHNPWVRQDHEECLKSSAPSIHWHVLALYPVLNAQDIDFWGRYSSEQLTGSKEVEKKLNICRVGSKPMQTGGKIEFISPIREDYLPALRHLAGGAAHRVQLAKEWWTSSTTVAKENCVLPVAGCLSHQ